MASAINYTYVIYTSKKMPGMYRLRKTAVNPNTMKYLEEQVMVSKNIGELRQALKRLGRMRIGRNVNDHESIIETWL